MLAASGVLLAAGGAAAVVRTHGYDVRDASGAPRELVILEPWQFVVVQHLARRVCAGDRDDGSVPTADELDVAGFVDRYVASMPHALRRDLLRLFGVVEHVLPVLSKKGSRCTKLDAAAQDQVLSKMEASDQDLFRGAFAGVKSLLFMGYYRDPRTWKILAYEGPFVNRPPQGWTG
ncbi:hypothetical protein BH09MYX1_BH09MYX1_35010 [soil metagenome]